MHFSNRIVDISSDDAFCQLYFQATGIKLKFFENFFNLRNEAGLSKLLWTDIDCDLG